MAAMFGINNSTDASGLTSLWGAFQFTTNSELRKDLDDITMPLILTALDLKIRETIYRVFFQSAYYCSKVADPLLELAASLKYC